MPTTAELQALLHFPNEKLTVEYKSWLDLSDNAAKATLAKAAIALANEGGGVIVLGMREDTQQGGALGSQARPSTLVRYSQDDLNAAVNRYADPKFHCELAFATHMETNNEHAFVLVPGGMMVPIMSIRGCDGVIAPQRCYIRKPGPKSEEPFTAEEWRGVMERCIAARRESMLNAIRIIVQGHGNQIETSPRPDVLREFTEACRQRWTQLIQDLPPDDHARMALGHYEVSFEILGVSPAATPGELLRRMKTASEVRHTGWSPFIQMSRPEFTPRIVGGNVEAWLGQASVERFFRDSAHCDYWCAHPAGRFFLLRGYDEDVSDRVDPGTIIDIAIPIWRIGETLLYASRIASTYATDPAISIHCRFTGLRGRRLGSTSPGRHFFADDSDVSHDDEVQLGTRASAVESDDNLVEVLQPLLAPLYERFGFFELRVDLIRAEIARMRSNRF